MSAYQQIELDERSELFVNEEKNRRRRNRHRNYYQLLSLVIKYENYI